MVLEEKSNVARRKFIYSGISKKNTSHTIALTIAIVFNSQLSILNFQINILVLFLYSA